jgi:bidirectional [NiFe] hydrogenase diaphorase subunit
VAAGGTTDDGRFTLKTARCLGSCGLAPVVVLDGEVRPHQDASRTVVAVSTALTEEPDRERPLAATAEEVR